MTGHPNAILLKYIRFMKVTQSPGITAKGIPVFERVLRLCSVKSIIPLEPLPVIHLFLCVFMKLRLEKPFKFCPSSNFSIAICTNQFPVKMVAQ